MNEFEKWYSGDVFPSEYFQKSTDGISTYFDADVELAYRAFQAGYRLSEDQIKKQFDKKNIIMLNFVALLKQLSTKNEKHKLAEFNNTSSS